MSGFSEEKKKRLAVGATVAAVLTILFLVVILIIQFAQIGAEKRRERQLIEQTREYNRLIEEGQDNLEWYQTGNGLYLTARKYGWR